MPIFKPTFGSVPDYAHPLMPDRLALLFNEGIGSTIHDYSARRNIFNIVDEVSNVDQYWKPGKRIAGPSLTFFGVPQIVTSVGTSEFLPTGDCTIVLGYRKTDTVIRPIGAFDVNLATTDSYFGAHLPYADGTVYFDYGGNDAAHRVSIPGLTFGDDIWSFTVGKRGMEIWQNGIRVASNAVFPTRSVNTSQFAIGKHNANNDLASYSFFYIYGRQLSERSIQTLSFDPFPAWNSYKRRKFFVVSDAGVPPIDSVAPTPITTDEIVPEPTIDPTVTIAPAPITTDEFIPEPTIDTTVVVAPTPITTDEFVPEPTIDTATDPSVTIDTSPITTDEVVPVPTIDPTVTVAPAPITGTEVVPGPVVMPFGIQTPIEPISGLITRTITSSVWKSVFSTKLLADVPEKLIETPYATIEYVGEIEIGSVSTKRKSYQIINASFIVTVIGKEVAEVSNAFRTLERVLGNFAMKGNRIQLQYGQIYQTTIGNGRLSSSKESDDNANLVRWKKADLHAIYTKRF